MIEHQRGEVRVTIQRVARWGSMAWYGQVAKGGRDRGFVFAWTEAGAARKAARVARRAERADRWYAERREVRPNA